MSNCDLGGIFFGIVKILSIVPVSGGKLAALNIDGCRPSGSASYYNDQIRINDEYGIHKEKREYTSSVRYYMELWGFVSFSRAIIYTKEIESETL